MNKNSRATVLRDTITDTQTGEKRTPYARIPIAQKKEWLAKQYAISEAIAVIGYNPYDCNSFKDDDFSEEEIKAAFDRQLPS